METGFGPRHYREGMVPAGLAAFTVRVGETDLWIAAARDFSREAGDSVRRHRAGLEGFIASRPDFAASLSPVEVPPDAPAMVRSMAEAGRRCGVGPMAAVAGAMAEAVARDLVSLSSEVLVENGGDLYLMGEKERTVALWAGLSPFSGKVGIRLLPARGIAVCTSSATVGPSLSLGRADAATVVARSGALADAAASFLGNRLQAPDDIEGALAAAIALPGIAGAVAMVGGKMGAQGRIKLVPLGT
jgi:ApbE superfamily uncharacterized protein (UPF0280 family)